MKKISIQKNDANQRVDKFLTKAFPNLPPALLYKYIRKKYIKLNGRRCQPQAKLEQGDVLELYIKDEFFVESKEKYAFLRAPDRINVIFEDDNILLVNKEPGLLVHPDKTNHFDSLIYRIQKYLYKKREYLPENENSFAPALVNRIDRNTSGIVIAAKNAQALQILNEKLKNREIRKFYLCMVHGCPVPQNAVICAYLEKNEKQNRVYISNKPTALSKKIETRYRVIKNKGTQSLLEVELLTGRTHQIRAHLAHIGHQIVGDGKYGTNLQNKGTGQKWQALCSYKLLFDFKSDAGILTYLNKREFTVNRPVLEPSASG